MITEHTRRYWSYEYQVVERVLVPLLRRWGVEPAACAVLDVGCGEAGGLCALHDLGARCAGFDVDEHRIRVGRELAGDRTFSILTGDIFADPPPFAGRRFDLVVLHDVFEHLERKEEIMRTLATYADTDGRLLITFPPYYSAFGAHQQHLPFWHARLPFYHLIPGALGPLLPSYAQEHEPAVAEVRKLHRLKMGLRSFERVVKSSGLRVARRQLYLLSPNFIRFGLPPTPAGPLAFVPGVNELFCTGAVYLLGHT